MGDREMPKSLVLRSGSVCAVARGVPAVSAAAGLRATGAAVLATQSTVLDLASSVLAAEPAPSGKPRVAVVYFRRATAGGCLWPPSSTDELAQTQDIQNKILQQAAAKYGVELNIATERITDVAGTLEQVAKAKPDGLIAIGMDFNIGPD